MLTAVGARLAAMMFIQFFVWGAWYVGAPLYLGKIGFSGTDLGLTYSVGPLAAILSPFFVGMIADRFFNTEKVLGALHILGGAFMLLAAALMNPDAPATPFAVNMVFLAHTLCYFPTLALTNSLAMRHVTDSQKEFPLVRVFGTIGWIVAGVALARLGWGDRIEMFHLTGVSGILMGLYCLSLPRTPPPLAGQEVSVRQLIGADAFVLFKQRSFAIFMACSFLVCIPLAFYYQLAAKAVQQAGIADVTQAMSYGQMSEILFMVLMPLFFKRLGVKWMLAVGMAAWVLRYALFAVGAPDAVRWMMLGGILLHGICYDFFFVTGQIYTDQAAPKEIRAQAQGMLVLFTLGLGMLIGAQAAGMVEERHTPQESRALSAEVLDLGARIARLQEAEGSAEEIDALQTEQAAKSTRALQAIDWRSLWTLPAGLAALILAIFLALFKPQRRASGVRRPASTT